MKVETLTTFAPAPGALYQKPFSPGETIEVTKAEFEYLGASVRSIDPVLPKSVKNAAPKGKAAEGDKTGEGAEGGGDGAEGAEGGSEADKA